MTNVLKKLNFFRQLIENERFFPLWGIKGALLLLFCWQTTTFAQNNLFEAPDLYCVKNTNNDQDLTLEWNLPAPSPCFSTYEIYYRIGNKTGIYNLYTTIFNINQNNIVVANPNLNDTTYFYMVQRGSCTNTGVNTVVYSDTLDNRKSYPSVEIKSVSVVNGAIELNWTPDRYGENRGYLIYANKTLLNQFNTPIDTVFGNHIGTYIDNKVNVRDSQYTYRIRTLMTCDSVSAITPDFKDQTSAKLHLGDVNPCAGTVQLRWERYVFENTTALNYDIQIRTPTTAYQTVTTQSSTLDSFNLGDLPPQDSVYVRLKINLPNGEFAYSNEQAFFSEVPIPIEQDYVKNITVNADNSVSVEYRKDTAAILRTPITLETSQTLTGFQTAGNSSYSENPLRLLFEDRSTSPDKNAYFYRVKYRDDCGNILYSDTVQTLYISALERMNNIADISWRGFNIPNIDFVNYELYKVTNDLNSDTVLLRTYTSQSARTDMDDRYFDSKNEDLQSVCYFIVAHYYHLSDEAPRELLQSRSNIFCKPPTPKFFIPNAFVPEGYNKNIKPFILFASEEGYEFVVFNRWNQVVFKTNNINEAWDGRYKGEIAPFDSYTFVATFKDRANTAEYKESGTFLLVR
jgi:gliding motility-associated-like protein